MAKRAGSASSTSDQHTSGSLGCISYGAVPLLLVRHAKAGNRKSWDGVDRLRPLTDAGWAQGTALLDLLGESRPVRLLSSPYVRCVQTLEPLAEVCHKKVEE